VIGSRNAVERGANVILIRVDCFGDRIERMPLAVGEMLFDRRPMDARRADDVALRA
jgi:hypothetical protein